MGAMSWKPQDEVRMAFPTDVANATTLDVSGVGSIEVVCPASLTSNTLTVYSGVDTDGDGRPDRWVAYATTLAIVANKILTTEDFVFAHAAKWLRFSVNAADAALFAIHVK